MVVQRQQENGKIRLTSANELRSLPTEVPSISLKIVERKIDIFIDDNTELRRVLIDRCEMIVLDIIEQLCAGEVPRVSYRIPTMETLTEQVESQNNAETQNNFESLENFESGRSAVLETSDSMEIDGFEADDEESPEEVPGQRNIVHFARKYSREKLALMMKVMTTIHHLLINNTTRTRRSLFYELKNEESTSALINNQAQIDNIVECVANLLECSPWDTGLVATAKGLAAGDLTLTLANDKISYDVPEGALIPQIVSKVTSVRTKANMVIVVEKDTIFQKLLQEKCPSVLNCILITGKGFPDMPTRMLVKVLAEKVDLPIYVLVDADPYGMEILFIYKYGSIKLCRDRGSLACPSARWIGIRPSELSYFGIPKLALTESDVARLDALESRPYIDQKFSRELKLMREGKAEIEAISGLTSMYLPTKIKSEDYV